MRPALLAGYAALALAAATAAPALASGSASRPAHGAIEQPRSLDAVIAESAASSTVVVALFSRPDCPWCEVIRREQLRHLARDARARGVRVVEFDVTDQRPFAAPAAKGAPPAAAKDGRASPAGDGMRRAASPSALAASMGIRVVPTVAFLGERGEIAERLIGYSSPDFYGAYLDQRIDEARAALGRGR